MYSHEIRLRDLKDLASSPRNGGEDTVDTYYGWREGRAMTVAKGLGAATLSILTAWLVPFLKDEFSDAAPGLALAAPLLLMTTLLTIAVISVLRMDRVHAAYVRSMTWLQRLR
jgi:hypothetical protein